MGILQGPVALTRYRVAESPEAPDFDSAAFYAIPPDSEKREAEGFLPARLGEAYAVVDGLGRYFFRVRFDVRRPDPVLVRERLAEMVADLMASGAEFVSAKARRKLIYQAELELLPEAGTRTAIVEGLLDTRRGTCWLFSSAEGKLGRIEALLRTIGVAIERSYPWPVPIEAGRAYDEMPGCKFLEHLVTSGDPEMMVEPVKGSARILSGSPGESDVAVSVSGELLGEVRRMIAGGSSVVSARVVWGGLVFTLDAVAWRLSGVRLERSEFSAWRERLDQRMAWLSELAEAIDARALEVSR